MATVNKSPRQSTSYPACRPLPRQHTSRSPDEGVNRLGICPSPRRRLQPFRMAAHLRHPQTGATLVSGPPAQDRPLEAAARPSRPSPAPDQASSRAGIDLTRWADQPLVPVPCRRQQPRLWSPRIRSSRTRLAKPAPAQRPNRSSAQTWTSPSLRTVLPPRPTRTRSRSQTRTRRRRLTRPERWRTGCSLRPRPCVSEPCRLLPPRPEQASPCRPLPEAATVPTRARTRGGLCRL